MSFAGHSMGGALAHLLCCMGHLRAGVSLEQPLTAHSFGSPPVLSHVRHGASLAAPLPKAIRMTPSPLHCRGGGSRPVLWSLGMGPESLRAIVLDNDPVPRAFLSADPAFSLLKSVGLVRSLMDLRDSVFGLGHVFSQERFLYENVGQTYLLRGRFRGPGQQRLVQLHDRTTAEEHLRLAIEDFAELPRAAFFAVLDHSETPDETPDEPVPRCKEPLISFPLTYFSCSASQLRNGIGGGREGGTAGGQRSRQAIACWGPQQVQPT